jgi:hypothetical protein
MTNSARKASAPFPPMPGSHFLSATLAAGVIGCLTLASCTAFGRDTGPTRKSVAAEAYLAYPGAQEIRRTWRPEEHAFGIDGNDLSHNAQLVVEYALSPQSEASQADILAWYSNNLAEKGWTACEGYVPPFHGCKTIDERNHTVNIDFRSETGESLPRSREPVRTYDLLYTFSYRL